MLFLLHWILELSEFTAFYGTCDGGQGGGGDCVTDSVCDWVMACCLPHIEKFINKLSLLLSNTAFYIVSAFTPQ